MIYGEKFTGETMNLTGGYYVGCWFERCTVTVRDRGTTRLADCAFSHCRLLGDGWPPAWIEASERENGPLPAFYFSAKISQPWRV